jgi:hypothetical protein
MSKLLYLEDDEYKIMIRALYFAKASPSYFYEGQEIVHELLNRCILLYGNGEEEIEENEE